MSPVAISAQLQTIEKISNQATQSKETALAFLRAAGLLPTDTGKKQENKNKQN